MKIFGKIWFLVVVIIVVFVFIFFKEDMKIEDNIQVISKSENESIHTVNMQDNKYETNENKEKENINKENLSKSITIFISGEVKEPGVVTIESDKRLSDAVNLLGGFTDKADLNKVNLAIKIEDEKHYIIPKLGESLKELNTQEDIISDNSIIQTESNKVNINTATLNELDTLPGIGEATASKIINHRNEKGKFNSIEELKNVNGIGDKKYENIKDMISVN